MKQITTLLFTLVITAIAHNQLQAQTYSHSMTNSPDQTLEFLVGQGSDVHIEGYSGNEIMIENRGYEAPPERADGLRPLYATGGDNTGIGLSLEEQSQSSVVRLVSATRDDGDFYLRVPNQIRLVVEEMNWSGGDFWVDNHNGEIEILSRTGDVRMTNITGPVVISSTSGDVEVEFSEVSQNGPTSISLVSGFIDITLPEESEAGFLLSSISGEIYTDLDIELRQDVNVSVNRDTTTGSSRSEDALDVIVNLGQSFFNNMRGNQIDGTLNGGGVEINLKTISGDIYLRGE